VPAVKRVVPAGIAALAVIAIAVAGLLQAYLERPLNLPPAGTTYLIEPGASLSRAATDLAEQGILSSPRVFSLWGRLSGNAGRIKAGEYLLTNPTTPRTLLEQFIAGDVVQHTFTILEGWTVRDLLGELAATDELRDTLGVSEPEQLAVELGLDVPHAEGLFFPDTYQFPRGYSDRDLLTLAAGLMQQKLGAAWAARADNLPLDNAYELLILASIVERETGLDAERDQVAGVFVRRLQKGMRLQTDPTVIYGLGEAFDGNLTRKHLETDTPYNTYTRAGLPPTPIGLPGEASLLAAAKPAAGTALYFVASGDGSGGHVFSDTLEQHNRAVAQYLRRLREARRRERAGQAP
jgi:UPF0755 protein